MSTLLLVLLNILGGFFYLFIVWRQLKDDYDHQKVLRVGFLYLFTLVVFGSIFYYLVAPSLEPSPILRPEGLWFWGVFLGAFVATLVAIKFMKMRVVDLVETQAPSMLLLLSFFSLGLGIKKMAYLWLISEALFFSSFIFYFILKANYKKFAWYRSGRVGFASLVSLGVYFLVRSVIALFIPDVLSLAGRIDAVSSFAIAFLCLYSVYNLARK